jgi:hypothetical protein
MSDQVKLLLSYDIRPGKENAYRRFVLEELLPQAQELGLVPTDAWHTAYGAYPARLIGFVAEDLATAQRARASDKWLELLHKLQSFTLNFQQRLTPFRGGFQW